MKAEALQQGLFASLHQPTLFALYADGFGQVSILWVARYGQEQYGLCESLIFDLQRPVHHNGFAVKIGRLKESKLCN